MSKAGLMMGCVRSQEIYDVQEEILQLSGTT
jgi:hypothetical protein